MKMNLARRLAEEMKKIRPSVDVERTAKVLAKGMTTRELECALRNKGVR